MAAINHHLEWQIKKAKEVISNLPQIEKDCVNAYIQNLRDVLARAEDRNEKANDLFRKLKYFLQ